MSEKNSKKNIQTKSSSSTIAKATFNIYGHFDTTAFSIDTQVTRQPSTRQTIRHSVDEPLFANLPNEIAISESFRPGSLIYTVTTNDPDNADEFSIIDGNTNATFELRHNMVYTRLALDAETIDEYKLTLLLARNDHMRNSTLSITVEDANDHAPKFGLRTYEFDLSGKNDTRKITPGAEVGIVSATDGDLTEENNVVHYQMERIAQGIFHIDPLIGRITVGARLADQFFNNYTVAVTATDNGVPPLQAVTFVTVVLRQPSAPAKQRPFFAQSEYTVYVTENLDAQTVLTLRAAGL